MATNATRYPVPRRIDQTIGRSRIGRRQGWLAAAALIGLLAGPANAGSPGGKLIDPSESSVPSTPMELLAARVRSYGAQCETVDAVESNGPKDVTVICDGHRRTHRIYQTGGRWLIETRY